MYDYANEQSFKVYVTHLAMSRHFTTDGYDFQKYNGKVKANFDKFRTRNDVYFFYKLSKEQNWQNIMLANFIVNPKIWIRGLIEDTGIEVYTAWKKRIDSLTYIFSSDLSMLDDTFKENFIVSNGQHPQLMHSYLQRKISPETFSILAHITNVLEYWENNVTDKIISKDLIRLSRKYYPFLDIDKKKFTSIIRNKFEMDDK